MVLLSEGLSTSFEFPNELVIWPFISSLESAGNLWAAQSLERSYPSQEVAPRQVPAGSLAEARPPQASWSRTRSLFMVAFGI